MPTNANAYNSRITDETLEKKFRDSFRSQGGAELVDDLYASGVIIPVIDFSDAALGSVLGQNLQTAWDFSTGAIQIKSTTPTTIISNSGFWQVDLSVGRFAGDTGASTRQDIVDIFDGTTSKPVWAAGNVTGAAALSNAIILENKFVVFLRAGDSLRGVCGVVNHTMDVWYRQIADVSGNLTNPSGFTSS